MKAPLNDLRQISVIKLRTELTADHGDQFRAQALSRMEDQVRDIVLDMTSLEVIDSQGLENLLWLQETCAEKLGQVRLANGQEHIVKILEMTRLSPQFERYDSVEDAVKSLQ